MMIKKLKITCDNCDWCDTPKTLRAVRKWKYKPCPGCGTEVLNKKEARLTYLVQAVNVVSACLMVIFAILDLPISQTETIKLTTTKGRGEKGFDK